MTAKWPCMTATILLLVRSSISYLMAGPEDDVDGRPGGRSWGCQGRAVARGCAIKQITI